MVGTFGCWWSPSSLWSARGFRCSINNHRQPNKAAIQNEYTFDPEKCRWWRNRGRVVLSWSATGRRLVVGADLHNQLYHPQFQKKFQHVFMKLSTYGRKNVGISFEGRVIQKIMQITSRQTVGDQSAITLQMVCWSSSKMWSNVTIISRRVIGNWLSTTRRPVGKQSAIGRQTVGDRLRTKIIGWKLVADSCWWLSAATGRRLVVAIVWLWLKFLQNQS